MLLGGVRGQGFAADGDILGAERQGAERRFQKTQGLEKGGEDEQMAGGQDAEACLSHPAAGFDGRKRDGVVIEGAAAHDISRGGVPRVVFEKEEDSPGAQGFEDICQRLLPLVGSDVVEDSVAERHIE